MNHSEEQESVQASAQPKLCTNGCGFFANPACSDMCSKCYRDTVSTNAATTAMATEVANNLVAAQEAQQGGGSASAPSPPSAVPEPPVPMVVEPPSPAVEVNAPATAAAASAPEDDRPKQKNINRCFECNKRVGYTGFTCRCGYTYCGSHRHAEAHKCTFDYKAQGREQLATNNPLVVASKVNKI